MTKLLLVEDDRELAISLSHALSERVRFVDVAADGNDGLQLLKDGHYSIAIVDWILPGITGIELCRLYRYWGGCTPILMLTGQDSTKSRVAGLDAGADDYLCKPFEIEELVARIKALLRRKVVKRRQPITVGDLEIDLCSGNVKVCGKLIQATRTELKILEILAENYDQEVSHEAIIAQISTETEMSAELLRCHITRLRQKIKSVPAVATNIKSVYGLGYKLECS